MKVFTRHLNKNLMINIKKQTNIHTKPPNVFDCWKSLSHGAKDLMGEIEGIHDDINIHMLFFIGSNKDNFNFNTFRMPLTFLSAIYNDEILLKEAEISTKKIRKKDATKFNYRPKN